MKIAIGGCEVGAGQRCFVVGEIGQAHDGSLGTAHAYIDAVAKAGAQAVKFQTHIAAAESSPDEPWRVRFSPQDASRFEYWKRMEFTAGQWQGLAQHAAERGLIFLSSAFSFEAVDLLERVGVPAWKVGAGETTNLPLLRRMARTRKPVLLSSGLATLTELDAAVSTVRSEGAEVAVLQCTTMYPCPPEKLGLNLLPVLRHRFHAPVGLSDHSGTIAAGLAAAALGADLLEVHVVFSRECFGPDVPASLTINELRELVNGVTFIHRALQHPVDKDAMAEELSDLRRIFGKGLAVARRLPSGHRLSADDLRLKKPAAGIPAARFEEVVGRTLRREMVDGAFLQESDLE